MSIRVPERGPPRDPARRAVRDPVPPYLSALPTKKDLDLGNAQCRHRTMGLNRPAATKTGQRAKYLTRDFSPGPNTGQARSGGSTSLRSRPGRRRPVTMMTTTSTGPPTSERVESWAQEVTASGVQLARSPGSGVPRVVSSSPRAAAVVAVMAARTRPSPCSCCHHHHSSSSSNRRSTSPTAAKFTP